MHKIQHLLTVFLVITLIFGSFVCATPANAGETYKIEGYITDQNGVSIAEAFIIFNNLTVPSAKSDWQGHYIINAPAGTYHLNVWPPYNSSYVMYDQVGYVVSESVIKNITLTSGCRVYGFVKNAASSPMIGASVLFKAGSSIFGSGYFTNEVGYYYAAVPAGTYTIDAHPQTAYDPAYSEPCTYFPTYTETGYTVTAETYRNITVGAAAQEGKFLTAGYIVDENGKGIPGANIIFNVPQIVPSVYSDSTGYYQIASPPGNYHLSVWPPNDSSYLNYDQASYTVSAPTIKNITLPAGFKVSGFLKDQDGNPVQGGIVQVGNYLSGYFSTQTGYYFVAVLAGTYTINAHPGVGVSNNPMANFQTYIENNFAVYADITKNITVTKSTPTPTPAPTTQPTTSPTSNPASTPKPTLPQSSITIQTSAQNYQVGSTLTITGTLTNQNSNPMAGKIISLSYAAENSAQWISIGTAPTDIQGQYSLQWLIPASGTFKLKAQWAGDQTIQSTESTATVSFVAASGKQVFFVQSNSTITNLSFNSTSHTLTFIASGPTSTTGQTEVKISKTIVEDATSFAVSLDGNQMQFGITDMGDNWVLSFSYHHSSHTVIIDLAAAEKDQNSIQYGSDSTLLIIGVATAIAACLAVAGLALYKRRNKH